MATFDDMWASATPAFLSAFGTSISYTPQSGVEKTITCVKVDEKPRIVPANNDTEEHRECEILISARDNTEGHVSPNVLSFEGNAGDRVGTLHGISEWFVVDCVADNDPSMHRLVLRDKAFPKEAEFGG